ncbi:hypothetical protein MY4824_001994 [Beauveria thailandica]
MRLGLMAWTVGPMRILAQKLPTCPKGGGACAATRAPWSHAAPRQ